MDTYSWNEQSIICYIHVSITHMYTKWKTFLTRIYTRYIIVQYIDSLMIVLLEFPIYLKNNMYSIETIFLLHLICSTYTYMWYLLLIYEPTMIKRSTKTIFRFDCNYNVYTFLSANNEKDHSHATRNSCKSKGLAHKPKLWVSAYTRWCDTMKTQFHIQRASNPNKH